jgi:polysaccharide biosynthesis/export protein
MKLQHRPLCFFCCLLLLASAGCSAIGGDIVKITSVPENGSEPGLKAADRARLEEIQKTSSGNKGAGDGLNSVLTDKARNLSIAEYLGQYPDAGGAGAGEYTVGGYDVLNITVYDEQDFSSPALRISVDGYISFPLIGRLKVNGLTTAQIESLITRKLAENQILLNAHVAVRIVECNSKRFLVMGTVQNPGSYPLVENERVLDAISKAGGIPQTEKGAGRKAKIVRTVHAGTAQEEQLVIDLDLQSMQKGTGRQANIFMQDKDTLFIPMPENFYILGEVKKPGAYPMAESDITLVEGIGLAGGFTNIAARNSTRIIRTENGRQKIIQVRVDAITDSGRQLREIILQPNDIIIVPQSFF